MIYLPGRGLGPQTWSLFNKNITNLRDYNTFYGQFCNQFGSIGEMRSAWKLQKEFSGWMRIFDLRSNWKNIGNL